MATPNTELKPGDRVSFDVQNSPKKPYGFGLVTMANKGTVLIKPDVPLANGIRMLNITKQAV